MAVTIIGALPASADGKSGRGPVKRATRRLGLLLGLAGCALPAACAPFVSRPIRAPTEAAAAALETARARIRSGEFDRAVAAYREAIDADPEQVEIHRELQNVMIARSLRGTVVAEALDRLASAPDRALSHYLFGRALAEHGRQASEFSAAIAIDPSFYFAFIGLGHVELARNRLGAAERAFRRAMLLEPGRSEAASGLLAVLRRRGESTSRDERARLARTLLERDPSASDACEELIDQQIDQGHAGIACRIALDFALSARTDASAALAARVFEDSATAADVDRAHASIAALGDALQSRPAWARFAAFLAERAGDSRGARAALATATDPASSAGAAESEATLQRLAIAAGDLGAALERMRRRRFESGLALCDGGGAQEGFDRACSIVRRGIEYVTVEEARDAGLSLIHAGAFEAAIEWLNAACAAHRDDEGLARTRRDALSTRRFVASLRDYFGRLYAGDPEAGDPSLAPVLDRLRRMSRECLGANVVDPVVTRDYFPIGRFLDPDPEHGGGLAKWCDAHGLFLVLGERAFAAADAWLVRRIAASRIAGGRDGVYRVIGEDLLIPSRAEASGGEIAGFAFDSFLVLNADRAFASARTAAQLLALSPDERQRLLDDPIPIPDSQRLPVDAREPLSLAERAVLRGATAFVAAGHPASELPGLFLDAVEAHERAHLADARRFLPVFAHPFDKLVLLGSLGFSPSSVESWIEERAQAVALRDARSPLLVLGSTADLAPNENSAPPHSRAYCDLLDRWVAEVRANPGRYPGVDPERLVLPQLDRLADEGLRELAEATLAAEEQAPAAR